MWMYFFVFVELLYIFSMYPLEYKYPWLGITGLNNQTEVAWCRRGWKSEYTKVSCFYEYHTTEAIVNNCSDQILLSYCSDQ